MTTSTSLTLPQVVTQPIESLRVMALTPNTGFSERKAVVAALISTLHGDIHSDKQAVMTVLSILCSAFEEVIPQVTSCKSIVITAQRVDFQRAMELTGADGQRRTDKRQFDFPEVAHPEAALQSETASVYAGVALVLFASGRQARESKADTTTINRPRALANKFTLKLEEQVLFPGKPHGPSIKTLERVFSAFGVYTEPRMQFIRTFLAIQNQSEHYPVHLDVVMTQFRLMRYAGMTHVGAITKLVHSHPWTVRVPELEPYFRVFCDNLARFHQIPAGVRLYHRLLVPASDYLFLTSELKPLVAVAGSFLADVEEMFKQYVYNESEFAQLVAKVKAMRPGYEPIHKLSMMAAQLGVEEIPPLPMTSVQVLATPEEED